MIAKFTSPDYYVLYPNNGGPVVVSYDMTVVNPGDNPDSQALATTRINRSAVSPSAPDEFSAELPSFSPSIVNKVVELYVREVRRDGAVGPYGESSDVFYGGELELSAVNVIEVV